MFNFSFKKWALLGVLLMVFSAISFAEENEISAANPALAVAESVVAAEVSEADAPAAEMTDSDEVTITPHFTVLQHFDHGIRGAKAAPTDTGLYEYPLHIRNNIRASVDISKGNFTFTPFFQNRFESFMKYDTKDPLLDSINNIIKPEFINTTIPGFNPFNRNRVYFGTTFAYNIPDIINIAISPEFRLTSVLTDGTFNPDQQYRFNPLIEVSGSYDFGLSWYYSQEISFEWDNASLATDPKLSAYYYEGFGMADFEFLHFIPEIEDKQAFVFFEMLYGYNDTRKMAESIRGNWLINFDSDFVFGLKYSEKGFTPSLGVYLWDEFDEYTDGSRPELTGAGFRAGLSYAYDFFSFNCYYIGGKNTLAKQQALQTDWQSQFFTSVTFSL